MPCLHYMYSRVVRHDHATELKSTRALTNHDTRKSSSCKTGSCKTDTAVLRFHYKMFFFFPKTAQRYQLQTQFLNVIIVLTCVLDVNGRTQQCILRVNRLRALHAYFNQNFTNECVHARYMHTHHGVINPVTSRMLTSGERCFHN